MAALPDLNLPDLLDVNQFDNAPPREEPPRMALDLIDEDPKQPRRRHNPQTLQELADSIKAAGDVLQPVSLCPRPDVPGRYIINFGHRRCRAARMAGLVDVPYFLARKISSFDQVIENEQREDLSPMDLALFIQDRMDEGLTQQEIAQRLGKSKGYISRAASLIDAPAVVIEALQAGKLGGVTEAYELSKLHAEHPQEVAQLVARQQEIPRAVILALRDRLQAQATQPDAIPAVGQTAKTEPFAPAPAAGGKTLDAPARPKEAPAPAAGQTAKPAPAMPVVMAEYKGQPLVLDFSARPAADGHFFGRRPGSPRRLTVPAAQVRLVGFAAG